MKPLRLVFVGAGNSLHVSFGPVLQFVEDLEVVAAVDHDQVALERARREYRIERGYRSLDECLDETRPDAALIATPVWLHREQAILCAERGVHVILEKPMARTVAECDEIIAAHQKAGTILMIAFMKRYNRCMLRVDELIRSGAIGEVMGVRHNWDWGGYETPLFTRHWRCDRASLGGQFQDHGSHSVDLAHWWAGPVVSVSAAFDITEPYWEVENEYNVVCTHESGARSVHMSTRFCHSANEEHYLIFGETGTIELRHRSGVWAWQTPYEMYLHRNGQTREDIQPPFGLNWLLEGKNHGQYKMELEHFADCIRHGREPRTGGMSGRTVIEVINAAYLSAIEKRTVGIPLTAEPDLDAFFQTIAPRIPKRYQK